MTRRLVAGQKVGRLESEILQHLWAEHDWVSGRRLWEVLGSQTRAYTTVMTVLGRLVAKGLVERTEHVRGHLYRAAGDPDQMTAQAIRSLLDATQDPRAALAHFVAGLDDSELMGELEAMMKRKPPR